MDYMEPAVENDGRIFTVIADNPTLLDIFNKMKPSIEDYIQQRLQHQDLTMNIRLRKAEDRKKVITKRERYMTMLKECEGLRKLQEEFQLELQ